ncbi:MAG: GNAT family N-acetyltransferase [Gemmatimonadetes bacterium]|nr:GNAT family N-acetyltransferase [Gemmatimonadota bacterium]MBT7860258.1 GNAT family N-acetyltransferase [Gemmatimonadota bacterium]
MSIRPLQLDDVEAIHRFASDELVARTTTTPHPYPEDGASTYVRQCIDDWENGVGYSFAILAGDEVIGSLGLGAIDRDQGTGQCDYAIGSAHWNRGIMTQAVAAAVRYAFVELGLQTVRSACLQRNPASGRVLEKNRFTETHQFIYTHAKFEGEPARQFEIHRHDWLTATSDAEPLGVMGGTVVLAGHNPNWSRIFESERDTILQHAGDLVQAVEHIGSTAVPGLVAKPILDVAVVLLAGDGYKSAVERLTPAGYLDRGDKGDDGGYLLVRETAPRVRAAHLHLVEASDPQLSQWLAFRDILRSNPEARQRYADLKRTLARDHELDRQGYTAGKETLVHELTAAALNSEHRPLVRKADTQDLDLLAEMNHRLVVDQGSQPPSINILRDRFAHWLETDEWSIHLFLLGDNVVGYAAHQTQADHYNPDQEVVFVRHFYIDRDHRRKGIGTTAFAALRDHLATDLPISLEVVASNPDGLRFWESLGFSPYFTSLKLTAD